MKKYFKKTTKRTGWIPIAVVFFWAFTLLAQPPILWENTYGSSNPDFGYSVLQTSDGGYIATGYTESFGAGDADVYLIKTDIYGNLEWQRTFGGSQADGGTALKGTLDGGFIIVGMTASFGPGTPFFNLYLLKTDALGNLQWSKIITGPTEPSHEEAYSVDCTEDGGYIIVGGTTPQAQVPETYLIKTSANGDVEWDKTFNLPPSPDADFGWSVEQTTDGGYIVAGVYYVGPSPYGFLLKTDANGDPEWWNYPIGNTLYSVQQTPDNGYIAAGHTLPLAQTYISSSRPETLPHLSEIPQLEPTPLFPPDVYLVKTDVSGNKEWEKSFGDYNIPDYGFSVDPTLDGGYFIGGITDYNADGLWDIYILKTDASGSLLWQYFLGGAYRDYAMSVQQTPDNGYIVGGTRSSSLYEWDLYLIRLDAELPLSDDSLSLAYNGNPHLAREPNSNTLHLVFTNRGYVVYTRSYDGGSSWYSATTLGKGRFPAITLDSDGLPLVCWIGGDYPPAPGGGALLFRRQLPNGNWSSIDTLLKPTGFAPSYTFHPSIAISKVLGGTDTVHIVFKFLIPANGRFNGIGEISFPKSDPSQVAGRTIETSGPDPYFIPADFPSVTFTKGLLHPIDTLSTLQYVPPMLHVAWQHGDTIYYATREIGQANWNVWGDVFWQDEAGHFSSHPFIETYGDSVFVVWQRNENGTGKEVYRGRRHIGVFPLDFRWTNLSQTPYTRSLYPVNASGKYTLYSDDVYPPIDRLFDVFYTTTPGGAVNISQSLNIRSIFPHSSLRQTFSNDYLYVVWQEGNESPYEIKSTQVSLTAFPYAYFTSIPGDEIPSPYATWRDTFFTDWQIPVDVGYDTVKYKFYIDPGYRYLLKAVAYHEGNGQWKEWIKIDEKVRRLIKYKSHQPETVQIWIPPAFYRDGVIEVKFERRTGQWAIGGPIYIYRYEYEEDNAISVSGIQGDGIEPISSQTFNFRNVFKDEIRIDFLLPFAGKVKIHLYDASGRLIKRYSGDVRANALSPGVYFLKIENPATGKSIYRKLLKIE